jgi:hypothetical protein
MKISMILALFGLLSLPLVLGQYHVNVTQIVPLNIATVPSQFPAFTVNIASFPPGQLHYGFLSASCFLALIEPSQLCVQPLLVLTCPRIDLAVILAVPCVLLSLHREYMGEIPCPCLIMV